MSEITAITADEAEIFTEIITLDLSTCTVAVCMASVLKDEAIPRFGRLQITQELADDFCAIIKSLFEQHRQEDYRQLSMFPDYIPAPYEIEHLNLSEYQTIHEQLSPLKALSDIDVLAMDKQFVSGLRFYAIALQPLIGEPIYFFRSYTHKKMLRRSLIYAMFKQGSYDRITEPVLLFDQEIDCMCRGNVMFIFHKKEFQEIFNFFEEVRQIAAEALDNIKTCIPSDTPRPVERDGLLSNVAALASLQGDRIRDTWLGQLLA